MHQWKQELVQTIGTLLNTIILIAGLKLLRLEIVKDRKRTHLHLVYSTYLIGIGIVRLGQSVWTYFNNGKNSKFIYPLITDSLLLLTSILMFISKLGDKQYQQFLGQETGSILQIRERLRKGSLTVFDQNQIQQESFPYLKVDVISLTSQKIKFAVFLKQKPFSTHTVSLQQLHNFNIKTQILDLQHRLKLQKQLDINQIGDFFDELLSQWQNYQVFVLQFFGIPKQMHWDWIKNIEKIKQQYSIQGQFDPNSIYFSFGIIRMIKYNHTFQLLMQISIRSGKYKRQVNKTLKQIEDLHNKICLIEIKTRKSQFKLLLPDLPKITNNINDSIKIEQKRQQYEKYFQKILNDRNVVKRHKHIRKQIYDFFGYPQSIQLSLRKQSSINYSGLTCHHVRVKTKLNQRNQPTVFYYFQIKQYDKHYKKIRKSYRDFKQLDFEIRRYLKNSQTQQFVELFEFPSKTNFISQKAKQQLLFSLSNYLNFFLSGFPDISELYQFKVFLNIKQDQQFQQQSFIVPVPQLTKQISEFTLQRSFSNLSQSVLSEKIDGLGNYEFDLQIR